MGPISLWVATLGKPRGGHPDVEQMYRGCDCLANDGSGPKPGCGICGGQGRVWLGNMATYLRMEQADLVVHNLRRALGL